MNGKRRCLYQHLLKAIEERRGESRGRGHLRLIELSRVFHSATADYSWSYGTVEWSGYKQLAQYRIQIRGRRCPIKQCPVRL